MLIPKYYFSEDYAQLQDYLMNCPHTKLHLQKGAYLWKPGELIKNVYYIQSGVAQAHVIHADGHQKILSFHSKGTVYPGCHQSNFKIEQAIVCTAITDMDVLCFSQEMFHNMYLENHSLSECTLEWYASYINLLIYESAHQEYNNSFIKLCNLLYLLYHCSVSPEPHKIYLTQENLSEILTINRVSVAKCLSKLSKNKVITPHKKWIEIIDIETLCNYCTEESLPDI